MFLCGIGQVIRLVAPSPFRGISPEIYHLIAGYPGPVAPLIVVCVKFSKLVTGESAFGCFRSIEQIPLFDRKRPSLRPDLPSGRAPRAAAVKDGAAKAAAPAQPARSVPRFARAGS